MAAGSAVVVQAVLAVVEDLTVDEDVAVHHVVLLVIADGAVHHEAVHHLAEDMVLQDEGLL